MPVKMPGKNAGCYIHDPSSYSSSSNKRISRTAKTKTSTLAARPALNFLFSLESDYAVAR